MNQKYSIYWLLHFFFLASLSNAQETEPIVLGERFSFSSEILGEDRPFLIYLPEDYDPEGDPVSVMYLLDGQGHFHHTTGIVSFLRKQNRIPNLMVVAIPNTRDRTHDLTPLIQLDSSAKTGFPTAGGADKMLSFLKDELIPEIESNYNTSNYRILVGHSFGGLFSVNALLKEPELFNAHISISPSMWWDQQHLVSQMDSALTTWDSLEVFYYMTMGNEGGSMLGGAMKLAALFEEKSPEGFQWDFKVLKEETHGSIPHRSTYNGLEAIFKEWHNTDLEELYVLGGLQAIEDHHRSLGKKFGVQMELGESEINSLGYDLMGRGADQSAIEVFLENIRRFPKSFNVYDSAGEAYMKIGNHEKAIEYYKKSLELNPVNRNGLKMLEEMDVIVDPMQNKIKLSDKEISSIVGTYRDDQLGEVQVSQSHNVLNVSAPGLPVQELHAFPNNIFALTPADVIMSVVYNSDGEVDGIEVQTGIGSKQFVRKVE